MTLPSPAAPAPDGAEVVVHGIGVAPGVAIGPAYVYAAGAYQASPDVLAPDDVERELKRFEDAVARSERELAKVRTVAREKLGDDSARIFDAQRLILRDRQFYDATRRAIQDDHTGAGWAVESVLGEHIDRMQGSGSAILRDRAGDFADVRNRVLRNLQKGRAQSRIDRDRIVVAENLTAADVLLFSRHGVLGCVLDFGGPTSHVSIMARALGVPTVVGLHALAERVSPGDVLVLDGYSGVAVLNPTPATLETYRAKQRLSSRLEAERDAVAALPAETQDGHAVSLQANLEFPEELPLVQENGAEGIGLFRTEMLFLAQGRALDEAQQYAVYRDALRAAAPHPVTFRLLDLGGDKVLPMARRESNPFLGWRGIRILADKPDLFRPQLRALLRVAAEGPARLLVPMVSTLTEVQLVRDAVRSVASELAADGLPHDADVPLGIMVEVPAVAILADRFARAVDFFSIGTNDLTQYTLAVDRGNDLVADLYRTLHPAVLGLVHETVQAAERYGIAVSVCGEVAADPRVTPLLVGLGVGGLSASPAYLPLVKRVLRAFSMDEARDLARRALSQPDADAVARILNEFLACHNRDLALLLGLDDAPADGVPAADALADGAVPPAVVTAPASADTDAP